MVRIKIKMTKRYLCFLYYITFVFLTSGCISGPTQSELAEAEKARDSYIKQMESEGIRMDLSNMTDKEIKSYFDSIIHKNKIFFYSGGFTGMPFVDSKDVKYALQFRQVFYGDCTVDPQRAIKFNQLMLDYLKKN